MSWSSKLGTVHELDVLADDVQLGHELELKAELELKDVLAVDVQLELELELGHELELKAGDCARTGCTRR